MRHELEYFGSSQFVVIVTSKTRKINGRDKFEPQIVFLSGFQKKSQCFRHRHGTSGHSCSELSVNGDVIWWLTTPALVKAFLTATIRKICCGEGLRYIWVLMVYCTTATLQICGLHVCGISVPLWLATYFNTCKRGMHLFRIFCYSAV